MHRTTGDNYALDANGNRVFTEGPPPTTVDAGILNSIQEEIANAVEASGQTLYDTPGADLNNQLALAIQKVAAYDSIVYSQETFNAIWERVGANEYQILDTIGSVYFKAYFGGYNMSGPSSPLSGGDTWGRFKTNNCTFIMCDGGNFFQMGDTPSYWEISTSNTVVYNMDVRGVGAVAAAITKSIYIAATAENCKLLFCTVADRKSNAEACHCFLDDSGTGLLMGTTITGVNANALLYGVNNFAITNNIHIYDCIVDAGIFILFYASIVNGVLCTANIHDIETTTGRTVITSGITQVTAVYVKNIIAGTTITGFSIADTLTNCRIENCSADGNFYGVYNCNTSSGVYIINCTSANETCYAFYNSQSISSSYALSLSSAAKSAYGFYNCTELSGCKAYDIETSINNASYKAVGFQDCNQLSACTADTIAASAANAYAYGFHTCTHMSSSCHATNVTSITAGRDIDFYQCSTEPFKGNANTATPYGYTEVYNAQACTSAAGLTYTPAKDCLLFGFVEEGGASHVVSIRNGAAGKNVDQRMFIEPGNSEMGTFCLPAKGGVTVYFAVDTGTVTVTLRYMPFGTTT